MNKSLKRKISLIYIFLIIAIMLIGITAVINLYSIKNTINLLFSNNYQSINAANTMFFSIEEENSFVLNYIHFNDKNSIDEFYKSNSAYDNAYYIELNNITEPGEKDLVSKIDSLHIQYVKYVSQLQKYSSRNTDINFYNTNIKPVYSSLNQNLKKLSYINQSALITKKNTLIKKSQQSIYTISVLLIILVLGGFIISRFLLNRFLHPICSLTEAIKSIREGNFEKQVPIYSYDEVGQLADEFNKMILRLEQLEHTTKGKLLTEKNKSIAIVKSLSDPLIVLDTNYKIILLNSASERYFNIKESNAINKHFTDVIHNDDLYEFIRNAFETNSENNSKIINISSCEKDYYFNTIATIIKDNISNIKGIVILFQNITQLKQLEKIKSDFISTISHEFKTPLTSIMMGVSLIDDENIGMLNDKQEKILSTIKEGGEKLTSLVTNLLQLSKIKSSNSIFNISPCSIVGIIENCVREFYDRAASNEIKLFYDADESLPKINGDYEKISWVINNLLSNAFKYTNAGDEISVSAFVEHNKMCVSVKDTGVGIPEQYVEKIFDKFVQVKGYDSEVRGTGLGLAISKEIVEAHGGEIWCESHLDSGSTFTFTLPLAV